MLCGLSLHKGCTCCLNGCEFICAAALLITKDVSLYSLPLALNTLHETSLSVTPEPWEVVHTFKNKWAAPIGLDVLGKKKRKGELGK